MPKLSIPLFALAMATLSGCAQLQSWFGDDKENLPVVPDNVAYTACNLRYADGHEITPMNFLEGKLLPFGAKIKILSADKDGASFITLPDETRYHVSYDQAKDAHKPITFFRRIFSSKDFNSLTLGMPPGHIKLASAGKLQLGMNKDEVILALGYPPRRRTASLDQNTWIYYLDRIRTFRVIFKDGKLIHSLYGED